MDPIKEKYDIPCGATKSYFHPKIMLKNKITYVSLNKVQKSKMYFAHANSLFHLVATTCMRVHPHKTLVLYPPKLKPLQLVQQTTNIAIVQNAMPPEFQKNVQSEKQKLHHEKQNTQIKGF